MTDSEGLNNMAYGTLDEITYLSIGSFLLRWRRIIIRFAFIGLVIGIAAGLMARRVFRASAILIPQQAGLSASSGLGLAASQLGITVPSGAEVWTSAIYAELLRSPAFLSPIVSESLEVAEQGGRRIAVMDLFEVKAPTPELRLHWTIRELGKAIDAEDDRRIGAVRLAVTTRWPSVSLALAKRLLRGLNDFNIESRQSQAGAERRFIDIQVRDAEQALRQSENTLQDFLQHNRLTGGATELTFEHDRLQRAVTLRQQLYTSLLQQLAEVRIREVRDTPVLTVLEAPQLPAVREGRMTVFKGLAGGLIGTSLAVMMAVFSEGMNRTRRSRTEEANEFFDLVRKATPRFFLKKSRGGPDSDE